VFGLIGEESEFSSEITGIRYKYQPQRSTIRIEVWVKTSPPEKELQKPGGPGCELDQLKDEK